MRTQVRQTCSKCFAALRQLRSIRRSVSNDVMQSLIVALVFSRLDCGSTTLAGFSKQLMDRLQSAQNAAARLIFKACRQPLLRRLHWLRMPERVLFRLAVLVYRCLHGSAPGYLVSARVTPQRTSTTALFDYISAGRSTRSREWGLSPLRRNLFKKLCKNNAFSCKIFTCFQMHPVNKGGGRPVGFATSVKITISAKKSHNRQLPVSMCHLTGCRPNIRPIM